MNCRLSRKLMLLLGGAGVLLLLSWRMTELFALWAGGIGLLALSVIQALLFYRCPHCRKSLLAVKNGLPEYCPFCGQRLE